MVVLVLGLTQRLCLYHQSRDSLATDGERRKQVLD